MPASISSLRMRSASAKFFALRAAARAAISALDALPASSPPCGRQRLQERVRVALQQPEDAAERLRAAARRSRARPVELVRQLEQHRDRFGRIEVVVHRLAEARRVRLVPVDRRRRRRRSP